MPRILLLLVLSLGTSGCALLGRSAVQPDDFELIAFNGGTFEMGDVITGEDPDATPVHIQHVRPFLLAKYETTLGQFSAWAAREGREMPMQYGPKHERQAVANVTWHEADAFCRAIGLRLPTEVEWEFAARSGGLVQRFPGTSAVDSVGAYIRHADNSVQHAFLVGTKQPNQKGVHDMGGNVYEWIGDFYLHYPEAEEPEWVDTTKRDIRVIRGGSFRTSTEHAQTFRRAGTLADLRSDQIGFRCAGDAHDNVAQALLRR